MVHRVKLQILKPPIDFNHRFAGNFSPVPSPVVLRLPARRQWRTCLSGKSIPSSLSSNFTATVGAPSLTAAPSSSSSFRLTQGHVVFLNAVACLVAISSTWLFLSAIPALLSLKRAAESLEKLLDTMREELPDTMAAVRLSGMEISDLTTELTGLGQEITQGVRNSARAVRATEEKLRQFTNTNSAPNASFQEVPNSKPEISRPQLAKTLKGVRDGIVKSRAFWQMFFSVTRFSRLALNYLISRSKRVAR